MQHIHVYKFPLFLLVQQSNYWNIHHSNDLVYVTYLVHYYFQGHVMIYEKRSPYKEMKRKVQETKRLFQWTWN